LQLYEQLTDDIKLGAYPAGQKLPSKRQIAAETGVSVITVEHAFEMLMDEGYAESRQRSGYFSSYKAPNRRPLRRAAIEEMTAPDRAPEDFPFSAYFKTMRRVLTEYGEKILEKAPGNGCVELRRAIAGYLGRNRGIFVLPSQIVIGSGAEYLYSLIVQLMGRERPFALEEPGYEKIRKVYGSNGVSCRMLKMGDEGIKSEELDNTDAGVLHITPYHSYPSGVTATGEKRREYAAWAEKNHGYIVEDDYEAALSSSRIHSETVFSLAPEKTIFINTFTKTLAPAIRIGFMVLPEKLVEKFNRELGFYSCTVPVYEQLVLAEFIENGSFERYINRKKRNGK